MNYFTLFPKIGYTLTEYTDDTFALINRTIPNMTVRLRLENFSANLERIPYVTYRVHEGERPDTLAAKFYGSSGYVWIIFLANNMRDWYDWPMSNDEFQRYIAKKYESVPGALDGVSRSQNLVTRLPETQYFHVIDGVQYGVNEETYLSLAPIQRAILSVYDQEEETNSDRQEIRLIEPAVVASLEEQFLKLMQA